MLQKQFNIILYFLINFPYNAELKILLKVLISTINFWALEFDNLITKFVLSKKNKI